VEIMLAQLAHLLRKQPTHWLAKLQLGIAAFAISLGLAITTAFAAETGFEQCRNLFADGNPPALLHQENLRPRALCFSAFAVLHSGISRTPIFVAERLNREVLLDAKNNQRTNRFFAEARMPRGERAELDDYEGSGFDRGHMAPAGDMATDASMAQSFSLANIVPQPPMNNRKTWASIEKATRHYVMRAAGDVFVITGSVFDGAPPTIGDSNVWVPQYLYKLVYDPTANRVWAHWLENTDGAIVGKPISYKELVKRTGIEFFPGMMKLNSNLNAKPYMPAPDNFYYRASYLV
jgi:endonuclease G